MTDRNRPRARWVAAVLASILATFCGAPAAADQHADDAALGRKVYDDLKAKFQLVPHSKYLPALQRVGARIVQAAGPQWFTERFYVIRGNELNAFSAPGGYVFVDEGLLRAVDNDDELANVLGHETAHLVLGHVRATIEQQKRRSFLSNIGRTLAGRGSQGTQSTFEVANTMGHYTFLGFTRQQEYEADEHGAELAAKAGYNPWGTVWFFRHVERLVGDAGYEQYVQQHPSTNDRIEKISGFLRAHTAQYGRWQDRQPEGSGLR